MILRLWFFLLTWTRSKPPPSNFDICQKFFGFFFEGFPYEELNLCMWPFNTWYLSIVDDNHRNSKANQ